MGRRGPKKTPLELLKLRGSRLAKGREQEAKVMQKQHRPGQKPSAVPSVPGHLSVKAKKWVRALLDQYTFNSVEWALVIYAAEAADRCAAAREALADGAGLTFIDRHGSPKPRPEVQIELSSRAAFARIVRQLQIDQPAEVP